MDFYFLYYCILGFKLELLQVTFTLVFVTKKGLFLFCYFVSVQRVRVREGCKYFI